MHLFFCLQARNFLPSSKHFIPLVLSMLSDYYFFQGK